MITLSTLPTATKQELLDQVATHLLTQNKQANSVATCRYRIGKLKCAAGCLIGKNEYKESFEGYSWSQLVKLEQVPKAHMLLIVDLQHIHDQFPTTEWENELREYATKNDLVFNWKG